MNLSTFGNLRCNFIIFLSECSHLLCTQGLTQHCCHLVCIWCTWHYVIATFNYCHLIYIWHVECKVHLLQFLACDITILISVKEFESFSDCFSIVVLKLTHLKWSIRLPKFTVYYQNVAIIKSFLQMFSSSFTSFAFIFISSRNSGNSIVPLPSTSTCHWWWCTSLVL